MAKENKSRKGASSQKLSSTLTAEQKAVYEAQGRTSLISGNGAKLGTEYAIISELAVRTATINNEERTFNAWECAGGTAERPILLTPRRMAEFTPYADDEEFLKTVQWLDDYNKDDAFVLSGEAKDLDEEFAEIVDYLNDNDKKVTLIGKAKHPRFTNAFIYIYA